MKNTLFRASVKCLRFAALVVFAGVIIAGCVIVPPPGPVALMPTNVTHDGDKTHVTVDARAGWINTAIPVKAGQKIHFTAVGEWGESPGVTRTADGGQAGIFGSGYWGVIPPDRFAPWGALLGRVGSSIFLIGVDNIVTMPADGDLLLGINGSQDNLGDNHGYLVVTFQNE
jgi:hypothetical protein